MGVSPCCSLSMVLAEIVFLLYKTGESMLDATTRPYIIRIVCHGRYPDNDSICRNLDQYPNLEDDIQGEAGMYLVYYRILVNLPAIFLGLFCGAWSDKYGRKIPMMLPSLGSVLAVLLYMLSISKQDWAIGLILVGAALQGVFGKSSVITMAVNSYASDISDKDDRTQKLGKLLAMNFFGLTVGSLLSGLFQDMSDLPTTFCVVVVVHGASVLITVIFMKETIPLPVKRDDGDEKKDWKSIGIVGNIKDSLTVLSKHRLNNGRSLILFLFLTSLINQTCKVGEMDITLLFVSRTPLSWPKSWYGYLLSVDYAVMGSCLFFILPILSNILKLPDIIIIIIGITCKIVRLTWAGFCTETWMVYLSVVIGSFAGLITSSVRSLMSKVVEEDEHGKTFSLLASAETASKLLGTLIFVSLYGATAYFFPGFAYIFEALLYVILLGMMVWMYKELRQVGTYNLIKAITDQKMYGSDASTNSSEWNQKERRLQVVDELEEEPKFPQPLPATTP
ncbi:hypothetical protein CHS0354_017106 [Potamilus streckersoni]|uniref:Proton-coupled folate transporter n=1 Tax=Potamilus streckersoni TaxID=2493646 RepID=A0AAE0VT31_9BIVA|nr:hypothetical protein CHS0354_017106 [Potamilus streckersoni]